MSTNTARDVPCFHCGAEKGEACRGTVRNSHGRRLGDWARAKSREAGRKRAAEIVAARRPSPAVEVRPAAPVASGGVEVRGVVAVVTPNGMRIVLDDGADAFWVRPTMPNCDSGDPVIVSIRLADPTEGG